MNHQRCPYCDRPYKSKKPQLTEGTHKQWKALQLVGAVTIVAALWLLCAGVTTGGIVTLVAGIVLYVAGRFAAWWHHA